LVHGSGVSEYPLDDVSLGYSQHSDLAAWQE
jgi:hypothetical protein